MRLNDAVFGVILLLFSAAMIAYARTFPEMPGQDYGPALFPTLIGVGLGACGLVLVVSGIGARRAGGALIGFGDWLASPRHRANLVLVLACMVFYILASDWLGFIPCSLLILSLLTWRLGARPAMALAVAVVATLAIHTAFYEFLRVPLPWGLLLPVAW